MIPKTNPDRYTDVAVLEVEYSEIFDRCWLFAGLTTDIPNDEDWLTTRVGHRSVFVQNFNGEIRAFSNVCSHRQSALRDGLKGHGPVKCPYHGWIYDQEGFPCAIPHRPKFSDLGPDRVRELRLHCYTVDTCGKLIFIRRQFAGPALKDYLAEFHGPLEQISHALGRELYRDRNNIQANWKINVENTLESYHLPFVHAKTFMQVGIEPTKNVFVGPHSSGSSTFGMAVDGKWQKLRKVITPKFRETGYTHWLIFPNFLVSGGYGLSFNFNQFFPISENETLFENRAFEGLLDESYKANQQILAPMMDSIITFNRTVFAEDTWICEQVQKGARQAERSGILSEEEDRIVAFQKAYEDRLSSACGPSTPASSRVTVKLQH